MDLFCFGQRALCRTVVKGSRIALEDPQNREGISAEVEDPDAPPLTVQLFRPAEVREALPEFAEIIDLRLQRRGGEAVPDWCDLGFADLVGRHAHVMLSSFDGEEPDPLFRLVGEKVAEVFQFPAQHRRVSALAPRFCEPQFRAHFRRIQDEGLIGLTSGKLPAKGRDHADLRILELPFRNGGATVERVLHVLAKAPV